MHKITLKEFTELNLGDVRRNKGFITILENVIHQPGQSITGQKENWYGAKATYEFFKNKKSHSTNFKTLYMLIEQQAFLLI